MIVRRCLMSSNAVYVLPPEDGENKPIKQGPRKVKSMTSEHGNITGKTKDLLKSSNVLNKLGGWVKRKLL